MPVVTNTRESTARPGAESHQGTQRARESEHTLRTTLPWDELALGQSDVGVKTLPE